MKSSRKLLVATPLKNGASINYIGGLMRYLQAPPTGYASNAIFNSGAGVNFARNDIAHEAVVGDYDELVMVDEDLLRWEQFLPRLLSHDVDIVSGVYCKRHPGKPKWLFVPRPGAEVEPDGLLECSGVPTGFIRIKVRALRDMMEAHPNRRFYAETEMPEVRFEWFPMGIVGAGAAERRLEDIQKIILRGGSMVEVEQAANGPRDPGRMLGEDYYFSHLARKAGLRVFVDLGMGVLPHTGTAAFPLTAADVGWESENQALPEGQDFE